MVTSHSTLDARTLGVTNWRKSSYSGGQGNCVEFASLADNTVAVRHSQDPTGPAIIYTKAEIAAMIAGVKDGEFDDLA